MTPDAPQQPPIPDDPQPTEVLPAVDREASHMPAAVHPTRDDADVLGTRHGVDAGARPGSPYKVATWVLAILLGLLLITVVAALLTRGVPPQPGVSASPSESVTPTASPSASPSPSATPSPSITPEPEPEETTDPPPPPPAGPVFTSFSAPSSVTCADEFSTAEVTLNWTSSSATAAWVGIATDNAKSAPYSDVPTSGSITLPFPCSNSSQVYTVTLEDADGVLKHRSTTVTRSIG